MIPNLLTFAHVMFAMPHLAALLIEVQTTLASLAVLIALAIGGIRRRRTWTTRAAFVRTTRRRMQTAGAKKSPAG